MKLWNKPEFCKKGHESIDGTSEVKVDFKNKSAEFSIDDESKIEAVKEAIVEAGFKIIHFK